MALPNQNWNLMFFLYCDAFISGVIINRWKCDIFHIFNSKAIFGFWSVGQNFLNWISLEEKLLLDDQTGWAKSSLQPVNLPCAQPLVNETYDFSCLIDIIFISNWVSNSRLGPVHLEMGDLRQVRSPTLWGNQSIHTISLFFFIAFTC